MFGFCFERVPKVKQKPQMELLYCGTALSCPVRWCRFGVPNGPKLILMRLFGNGNLTIWSKRKPRGQSLVEFTLMLPILLMLLSGVIEYGFMLNLYLDIIDSAPRNRSLLGQ